MIPFRTLALTTGLATALGLASLAPASAQFAAPASPETQRFVAVATTGANYVDEASRTALANGATKSLQQFARAAIFDQDGATTRLKGWADVAQPVVTGRSAFTGQGPLDLVFAPLNAMVGAGSAIVGAPLTATPAGMPVTADQRAQLDSMQALNGREFDRAYITSQREAYQTLWAAYDTYARTGDDPALRDIASQELPGIQRQIDRLKTL